PWQLKRYEDLVFVKPALCAGGDGRSREDRTRLYGRGGVNRDKVYMLSSTWNAPREAFEDPRQFFEGRGIDGLLFPLHKTFEFLGMRGLPSFMANDVFKNPTIEADVERFRSHLARYFG
ncbi:MAG: NAD(P)H-dependent oxidoreductase, partial [Duodenibacillus sp.]|nr:NAD(P)H-dependent oxidoreductase [Duodenibacillus sp.]